MVCGSIVVRQLAGVNTLSRAAALARGAKPGPNEVPTAAALVQARTVYDRIIKTGAL